MAEFLTFSEAEVNSALKLGLAIALGSVDHVRAGIKKKVHKQKLVQDGGLTMFHIAAANGSVEIAELLLSDVKESDLDFDLPAKTTKATEWTAWSLPGMDHAPMMPSSLSSYMANFVSIFCPVFCLHIFVPQGYYALEGGALAENSNVDDVCRNFNTWEKVGVLFSNARLQQEAYKAEQAKKALREKNGGRDYDERDEQIDFLKNENANLRKELLAVQRKNQLLEKELAVLREWKSKNEVKA